MNQPPARSGTRPNEPKRPPDWRRPHGVAPGTWQYVNERSIANRYDQFVADTPLCTLDREILNNLFPTTDSETTLLDLGCGSGRTTIPLSMRGYRVIGVDLSQPMLEVLTKKAPSTGQIFPIRCNLVDLGCLADRSADHAICMFSTLGMVQHSRHRHSMLKHVARIVKPGGRLVVHVHNRWAALGEVAGFRRLMSGWIRSLVDRQHEFGDSTYQYRGLQNMFMHRFSRRELNADLNRAGWQLEQLLRVSVDGSSLQQAAGIPGGYIAVAKRPTM